MLVPPTFLREKKMKSKLSKTVESYRIKKGILASNRNIGNNGAFLIPFGKVELMVIISDGGGWDHVSVSVENRCPTWDEMHFIKTVFFDPDETVIQYFPPVKKYINFCGNCLHMWRKQNHTYELPPSYMV